MNWKKRVLSRSSSSADIFARLQLRGYSSRSWFVIVPTTGAAFHALDKFREDLLLLGLPQVRVLDCRDLTVANITEALHNPTSDLVVLTEMERWSVENWEAMDLNRSALERSGTLIFWMSDRAVSLMFEHAPNIRSYLALEIFHLSGNDDLLADDERALRLQELSDRFQITSEEVLRRAKRGTLPPSRSFAEWVVLLKKGDLL